MAQTSVKNRWVLSNVKRDMFFKRGETSVSTLERAEKFWTRDEAEYWKHHAMSDFQKDWFTEVLPVKITIEVLE
jgi:hypothetical protein